MDREEVLQILTTLGMSQSAAAKFSKIAPDRLCRFLRGYVSLHRDELDRLSFVLRTCLSTETEEDRLELNLPVDWSRVLQAKELEEAVFTKDTDMQDTDEIPGTKFGFSGDFDFSGRRPVLSFELPMGVLGKLIAGPASRRLFITRYEVVKLLSIIEQNPETSDANREIVRDLLKRA
jgi:hypothetical protein